MGLWFSSPDKRSKGINISNKLRAHYVFPCAGFIPFPESSYTKYVDDKSHIFAEDEPLPHDVWIIDYAKFGISIAILPRFLSDLPPCRIELTLADQSKWPQELWSALDARDSVHVPVEKFQELGIAKYLRHALGCWSHGTANFEKLWLDLPFGSSISLTVMAADPRKASFEIRPKIHRSGGELLTWQQLKATWGLDDERMPPEVSYHELCHQYHLAGDVVVVSFRDDKSKRMAFKSSRKSPLNIYHEIKVLLSMPTSEYVIVPPVYLVSTPFMDSSETGICGFLIPLYEGGSLERILTERRLAGSLVMKDQLQWALDLTSALRHVQKSPAKFYSDLRPDQLVLRRDDAGRERTVLLDFEQSRNIYNWAPPEIYYLEWIAELGHDNFARSDDIPQATKEKYGGILTTYLQARGQLSALEASSTYDNPDLGWYWPWITSTDAEKEAGMVYMLGKALWCIFEGYGDADIVLGRSGPEDGLQRFPEYTQTPPSLRRLIEDCTRGAREWIDGPIKIYRHGGKVFPLGKTGRNGEPEGSYGETRRVIREFWQNEMKKAERFVASRMRHDRSRVGQGEVGQEDLEVLHYLQRPTLLEVQTRLEEFEPGG